MRAPARAILRPSAMLPREAARPAFSFFIYFFLFGETVVCIPVVVQLYTVVLSVVSCCSVTRLRVLYRLCIGCLCVRYRPSLLVLPSHDGRNHAQKIKSHGGRRQHRRSLGAIRSQLMRGRLSARSGARLGNNIA